jgi:guanylate kinase
MRSNARIIFSAPSGAGKTTLVKLVLEELPELAFSISCTTRKPRANEVDGKDYYFISREQFEAEIARGEFVEYEEVYSGTLYGTRRAELDRLAAAGKVPMFEVDVKGGLKLKEIFGADALTIFIQPPSIEELRRRLTGRGTEAPEEIERRIARAEAELREAPNFDESVVNENLYDAVSECLARIRTFLYG